jgi:DNA-binding transcriptional LysR family regulator
MQPLSSLETFIAVADAGSFGAAARRVALSVPALSKSVKALEGRLGVRLFHRSTRGLAITPDGLAYLEQVRSPLQALQRATRDVRQARGGGAGGLRISAPLGFGRHCIVPLLPAFLAQHPGVEIDLRLHGAGTNDGADEGHFDIVISEGPPPHANGVARVIAPQRLLVCAAPAYLAQHGTPSTLADLAQHNCINVRLPHNGRAADWAFTDAGNPVAVVVTGNLSVNCTEAAALAACQGLGLAQLASYQCDDAIWDQQLVPVLKAYTRTDGSHWLCCPGQLHLPQRVRAFADHVCAEVPRRGWFDTECPA